MIDIKEAVIVLEGFAGNEAEDIRRCLTALYSVREGEQPLDRGFGLPQRFLDQPNMGIARNLLALEVVEKTKRYEPRVLVEKVEYKAGSEGRLIPVICLKKGDA